MRACRLTLRRSTPEAHVSIEARKGSNPHLDGETVRYDLRKPLQLLAELGGSADWRTRVGEFRTALVAGTNVTARRRHHFQYQRASSALLQAKNLLQASSAAHSSAIWTMLGRSIPSTEFMYSASLGWRSSPATHGALQAAARWQNTVPQVPGSGRLRHVSKRSSSSQACSLRQAYTSALFGCLVRASLSQPASARSWLPPQ